MTQQEVRDLREKSDAALKQELEETYESLFKLRFQASTRQLADNSQIKKSRRRVALLKTLLAERSTAAK